MAARRKMIRRQCPCARRRAIRGRGLIRSAAKYGRKYSKRGYAGARSAYSKASHKLRPVARRTVRRSVTGARKAYRKSAPKARRVAKKAWKIIY